MRTTTWPVSIQWGDELHLNSTVVALGCMLRDCGPTEELRGRVSRAVELCRETGSDTLILTGGRTSPECDVSEAQAMLSCISKEDSKGITVVTENMSRTTVENAVYTRKLLDEAGRKGRVYIVSTCYHMNRALKIFSTIMPDREIRAGFCFEYRYDALQNEAEKYPRDISIIEGFDWHSADFMKFLSR